MKEILKNLSSEYEMKYDKIFTSPDNRSIRQKLVPELLKSLKPRHNPSYVQLNDWLRALHKHRRDGILLAQKGARDRTSRRVHNNNRVAEVRCEIHLGLYLFLLTFGFS